MRQRIVAFGSRPEFWLACLLLWLLGSAGRSLGTPWLRVATTEALRWGAGIGLMLALSHCRRGSESLAKFGVLLVGSLALLGVADGMRPELGGMVGPYHDHQLYGSALLVLLPVTAAMGLTARSTAWRLAGLTALAAGTLCLVLSQTRSAWAGGLTAALVFGWLWLRRSGQPFRQGRTLAFSATVLLAGLAAVWMLIGTDSLHAPMTARAATVASLGSDGSWQARLTAWRGAGRLLEAHPFSGIGLGRYPGVQHDWTQVGRSLGTEIRPSLSEQAHNFYLQTAAEMGTVGLGLYLAALIACAMQGIRRLRQPRRVAPTASEALVIAALSALAGQAVDAVASPSWQFAETSLFFWAVLGLGWAAGRQAEALHVPVSLPSSRRFFAPQAAAAVACVALAAEVLPVGLLTPVEAYTHSPSIKLQSTILQQITTGCPLNSYCFSMTAKYSDGSSQNVTFDNGTPLAASFSCLRVSSQSPCVGRFGSGALRNQIVPSASDKSNTLQIKGSFSDNGSIVAATPITLSP